jgi:hypothetical protein
VLLSICLIMDVAPFGSTPQAATPIDRQKTRSTSRSPLKAGIGHFVRRPYKTLIGPRLRACGFADQQTEAAIGVVVLNRMLEAGRPDSVRRQPITA